MHVLDLEKQGEVNTLMTLVLINLLGRVDLCGLKFVQPRGDLIAARGL
ncbi:MULTISPECIES: hypothetical protein [unclassified Pseudoalteromonas]|nr:MULTISPECIES: hypothetical protein [unclassified Pseudoalteromonas]MDP2635727.1 hypothetical protein [Pseudoalteromonas sp. 1_MG-2023]